METYIEGRNVPRGLLSSIKNQITLVGNILFEYYRGEEQFGYGGYGSKLADDTETFCFSFTCDIPDDVIVGFKTYFDNWLASVIDDYNTLEKSWSISND